jgi:hypothetical protein
VKRTAKAFAPAAISSFLNLTPNGKPIMTEKVGAIGGGFGLKTSNQNSREKAEKNSIEVFINSSLR